MIPFNKPCLTGNELQYINDAVYSGHISGNGKYTNLCQQFFEKKLSVKKVLLTTSCTDALEMASILLNIKSEDEIIVPSYTFVSTALAFVRQGAKIVFCDSRSDRPGINEDLIEELITPKTRAIVVVHYAGVACDMDRIMEIAAQHHIFVVEDAAQSIESFYTNKNSEKIPLGSIGHLAAFSFHETKNVQCGEGGMLVINDENFIGRSEIIWEKGTNRAEFFRGEVNRYGWVDTGSSFLPSEITAAFLWAQLEKLNDIQSKRKLLWNCYYEGLRAYADSNKINLPIIPEYASNNGHLFYLIFQDLHERTRIIEKLRKNSILAVFHYLSLHNSPYYINHHDGRDLPNSDRYSECLVRLPLYFDLSQNEVKRIISLIIEE